MPPVKKGQAEHVTRPVIPAPTEAGASTGSDHGASTGSDHGASPEFGPGTGAGNGFRKRVVLLLSEAAIILALLATWLLVESVRSGKSLIVLFFYSFPSEFLVGLVPHEPVLIYWGGFHPAWVVALVSVVSTVMAEGLNYSAFGLVNEMPAFQAVSAKKPVRDIIRLFDRMPFRAILVAGFTPVPFFPIRFLVVMAEYPVAKYLLAVFLSRAPRFFILAAFGEFFDVPGVILVGLFVGMLALVNVPLVFRFLTRR